MKLKILLSSLFTFFIFSGINAQAPIGWATANGGTTGGQGGQTVTATTRSELFNFAASPAPMVIQIQDTIELNLYEMIEVEGNKTIVGLGTNAAIRYGGLEIRGNNVIVQNLEIFDTYDGDWSGTTHNTDGITVYGAQNVWIDHCWIHLCADGLLDVRSNGINNIGDFVTISNCKFTDHNKVTLVGSSDSNTFNRGHLNTTFYNCWWDGTVEKGVNQRMPRVRFGDVHVLNCYYEEIESYCIAANFESDVVVENTYFRDSPDPHNIGNVGEGIEDPDCVAIGNVYEFSNGEQDVSGDAFDPGSHYTYTPLPVMEVPGHVMNSAGTFDPVDNLAPVANTDMVEMLNPTGNILIPAVDNDTDADGGDLRLAVVINDIQGSWGIQSNLIIYTPNANATQNDTLLYQLVDTQGGVDTGMVIVNNPFVSGTKDKFFADAALTVSPNPVSGEAIVTFSSEFSGAVEASLFDLSGRQHEGFLAERSAGSGTTVFSLKTVGLPAGTYFLQVRQGQWLASERVVVLE